MASPVGNPSNQGNGIDQMKAIIMGWIRAEIEASRAGGIGLHVDGATGDLVADRGQFRSLNFVPGASGWGLQPNGNAEFNFLTLRGGIIGSAALTSPVAAGNLYTSATNFALDTTMTTKASIVVTTPPGFTTAAVQVTGRVMAFNPNTTGGDYLCSRTSIGAYYGYPLPLTLGSGSSSINLAAIANTITGLVAGNTFTVEVATRTGFQPWPAHTLNTVEISGQVLWMR